ncbi:MAG: hypothetical protein IPG63_04960 [Xanthomonadales bacterium]|nr:hypothetical protein [Xanthomonadales bacterium]
MNHAAILDALTGATSFDLFRLRAAIDRALRDPARSTAVRRCLQPGQPVEYFDARDNRSRDGAWSSCVPPPWSCLITSRVRAF